MPWYSSINTLLLIIRSQEQGLTLCLFHRHHLYAVKSSVCVKDRGLGSGDQFYSGKRSDFNFINGLLDDSATSLILIKY